MEDFGIYAKELDNEAFEVPKYREFIDSGDYAETAYSGFTEKLKTLLEKLDAGEVRIYPWTDMAVTVEFQPTRSPYFRLGGFGKSEMSLWYLAYKKDRKSRGTTYKEFEKMVLDENLRGTISIGFDDDPDSDYADDDIPDLILKYFYDKGKLQFETDMNVFKCDVWRRTIAEFFHYFVEFDYALEVNRKTLPDTAIKRPVLPIKKTTQMSLPI